MVDDSHGDRVASVWAVVSVCIFFRCCSFYLYVVLSKVNSQLPEIIAGCLAAINQACCQYLDQPLRSLSSKKVYRLLLVDF